MKRPFLRDGLLEFAERTKNESEEMLYERLREAFGHNYIGFGQPKHSDEKIEAFLRELSRWIDLKITIAKLSD